MRCWLLFASLMAAQTVPRVAAPFEFTLLSGGPAKLADYKGRVIALYLFSPD